MRPADMKLLRAHAKLHDLKLQAVRGVQDAYDLLVARRAICEADAELRRTGHRTAVTMEAETGVVIIVVRRTK